jgi:glycosyltransferase involved in cell wall biosynthesis
MAVSSESPDRVSVDGRFFRLGARKFHVKGITYGPFAPNAQGEMFASPEQTARDLQQITELGANVVRLYHVPPRWLLDLVAERGLKVLIDIPWAKHLCFLDSPQSMRAALGAVRDAVQATRRHPAVFAYSVVNEISAEIVRWSGVGRVQKFIDALVAEAKQVDPNCLCTFSSFPPTEFLQSESIDFVCFNVYLHQPKAYAAYLDRLQTLAGGKPLVLGEFGMDSLRHGEAEKCEFLEWQIELACRAGLAGTVVFSFTDDWFRGGLQIEDWGFGLTTRDRRPKESFYAVQRQYRLAPYFLLPRNPKASVVVATYNGGRTLQSCLESLQGLNYPDYEVILVDDGSTDRTPEIAKLFPSVRYIRTTNQGLSAARNTGIRAAHGEIVAFTDDDCRADEDWLYYLIGDLLRGDFVGIGGHNFLPPEDSCVAAAVVVSPGGPAHVMLTDREAEHIPGCNMAFFKWALEEIGLFNPIYRKAGDDVDLCWRLQERNYKIGFSPAGFVWHYRRSTVRAYLKQQAGYGEAEALLISEHPDHFNSFGGGIWRGRIYASSFSGLLLRGAVIYHGIFGSGFFQRLYAPDPVQPLMLCTSPSYHLCVNLPLFLLAAQLDFFLPLAIASFGISVGACALAAAQAKLPVQKRRLWSRPLVALLFLLQPIVRGWARFKWRLNLLAAHRPVLTARPSSVTDTKPGEPLVYWTDGPVDRYRFLRGVLARLTQANWPVRTDSGWTTCDLELPVDLWTRLTFTTASEELGQGKKNFQCRIRSFWSLPAKILFWGVTAVVGALILFFADAVPWCWMGLITLPLIGWVFDEKREDYECAFTQVLDLVASEEGLVKLRAQATKGH